MGSDLNEADLVRAAVHDEVARQTLFLQSYDRLLRLIRRNLPLAMEHLVTPEDILQDTYITAFQNFSRFRYQGPGSFHRWIARLARNRIVNVLEAHQAQKRGGGWHAVNLANNTSASTVLGILHVLAKGEKSPRQLAADQEAIALVHAALGGLPDDQVQAVQLRYVEGLSINDAAREMDRTEQAIKMLCFRALRHLRTMFRHSSRDEGAARR
jgi:RNA polymerase sigma-70 factor (ECF subfamily)